VMFVEVLVNVMLSSTSVYNLDARRPCSAARIGRRFHGLGPPGRR
jgi:hypothetical protein